MVFETPPPRWGRLGEGEKVEMRNFLINQIFPLPSPSHQGRGVFIQRIV
jgi:hypothetical protein